MSSCSVSIFQAYGKQVVKSVPVPLKTNSGPVIYTNLLGFIPMLILTRVGNDYHRLWEFWWSHEYYRIPPVSIPYLILGCLVGTGIGYSGWWCRSVVSATSFTLIGGKALNMPRKMSTFLHLRLANTTRLLCCRIYPSHEQVFDDFAECPHLGPTCHSGRNFRPLHLHRWRNDSSTIANECR